jgi:hypothetical protein
MFRIYMIIVRMNAMYCMSWTTLAYCVWSLSRRCSSHIGLLQQWNQTFLRGMIILLFSTIQPQEEWSSYCSQQYSLKRNDHPTVLSNTASRGMVILLFSALEPQEEWLSYCSQHYSLKRNGHPTVLNIRASRGMVTLLFSTLQPQEEWSPYCSQH